MFPSNIMFLCLFTVPPKLIGSLDDRLGPETHRVILDRNVTLTCPVSEDTDPPPVIMWFKDNQPLIQDGRVFVEDLGRSLTIIRAAVGDEARYHCVASNVAGEVQKNFIIEVQGENSFIIVIKISASFHSCNQNSVIFCEYFLKWTYLDSLKYRREG